MNTTSKHTAAIALAFATLAWALPASNASATTISWGGEHIQGNGVIRKQTRKLAHFTGVSLGLPGKVELRIGNTESVTLEADDNLLPLIETVIENGQLKIRAIKKDLDLVAHSMKFVVQAKEIDRIALGSSGSIDSDVLRGQKMQFDLGGSGSIDIKGIEGDTVTVTVGGSGKLKAGGGSANRVLVSIGGSGDVQFGQLKANEASVSLAGSGQATLWVQNSLSATIAGSGAVNYYGDPKVSRTVAGSGTTRRLGSAPR